MLQGVEHNLDKNCTSSRYYPTEVAFYVFDPFYVVFFILQVSHISKNFAVLLPTICSALHQNPIFYLKFSIRCIPGEYLIKFMKISSINLKNSTAA